MSNTITFELCAEDRARLDKLLDALVGVGGAFAWAVEQEGKAVAAADTTPIPIIPAVTKEEFAAVPVVVAEPEPATPMWTHVDIQQKVTALVSAAGKDTTKKAKVREVITAYAPNVGAIPSEKFAEVMAKLAALE